LQQASVEEVFAAQKKEAELKKRKDKIKAKKLHALGFEDENELVL